MKRFAFEIRFGLFLAACYALFWLWQTPGALRGPLAVAEVESYLRTVEERLALPDETGVRERLRAWALADDGKPFYMLNLMRYYPELRPVEGAPSFAGTPEQSNARYEREAMPLLFAKGGYPLVGGATQGGNILGHAPALDDWSRVLLVRYPSRRAFLELLSDPAYGPIEPYKLMALQVVLTPVRDDIVVPELRWSVAAAVLILFLLVAWRRALRAAELPGMPAPGTPLGHEYSGEVVAAHAGSGSTGAGRACAGVSPARARARRSAARWPRPAGSRPASPGGLPACRSRCCRRARAR